MFTNKPHPLFKLLFLLLPFGSFAGQIVFDVTYTDATDSGFYDPTLGTARQSAFEYACSIWSGYLGTSYAGETIHVSASFTSMGGTSTSATLGSAGPESFNAGNFGVGPTGYLWLNAANANHWFGGDLNSSSVEISAAFNSDVDNGTVLGSTDFYYGLDGNCGANIDFVSVLLHELGHGLGFTSLVNPASGAYYTLNSGIPNTPSIYDYYLGLNNGDGTYTPLIDMSDAERLAAATSDEIYWLGDGGTAAYGDLPQIYAPTTWENGSSLSHEDETALPNALMSPYYSGVLHDPDAVTLGMLSDLGWSIIPEPSSAIMMAMAGFIGLWIRRRFYSYF